MSSKPIWTVDGNAKSAGCNSSLCRDYGRRASRGVPMTPRARAFGIAVVALLGTGCISPQTLGRLDGVRFEQVLERPEVTDLIAKGATVGGTMLGALVILLALSCAWRAWEGRPWTGLVREWLIWVALVLYLMGSLSNRAYGP